MADHQPASQPPASAGGFGFPEALRLILLIGNLADLIELAAQRLVDVERRHDELAARVEQIAQALAVPPAGWTEYRCAGCGATYSALPFTNNPHRCADPGPAVDPADPSTWPF